MEKKRGLVAPDKVKCNWRITVENVEWLEQMARDLGLSTVPAVANHVFTLVRKKGLGNL